MKTGTVKFFNSEKGYGFIVQDDSKSDLFVHASNCLDEIKEGDRVSYEEGKGKRGPIAEQVRLEAE